MKAYKKIIGTAFVAVCLIIVIVTFIKVKGINSSDKLVLQLAHNQSAGSEIADSIAKVSDFAAKESGDEVNIKIFASGVLGTEKEEIEMVKAGIIDMAKVSSNTLGQFDDRYAILQFLICLRIRSIIIMRWKIVKQLKNYLLIQQMMDI